MMCIYICVPIHTNCSVSVYEIPYTIDKYIYIHTRKYNGMVVVITFPLFALVSRASQGMSKLWSQATAHQVPETCLKHWKTRESADSPPCNCRQLFSAMLKLKCSKPCVFHMFHLSKAFSKVHFVLRGPIQNSANAFSSRRNTQFFFTSGKKVGNLYFEVTCACWVKLMRVSSLLFNLATSISEVVET